MDVLRFLLRSGRGRVGLFLVCAFVFVAAFGRFLMPYDPQAPDTNALMTGFTWQHLLGTDTLGRDQLSRILQGALPLLEIVVISSAVGMAVGGALGVVAGYTKGVVDGLIMRALDLLLAFPVILMAIAIVGFFGVGERNVIIALAVAFVPGFARVARAATFTVAKQPYVLAARTIGDAEPAIVVKQVLPNILPVMLVQLSLVMAYAVLIEAALSFLGLSVQPPVETWGRMLADGRDFLNVQPDLAWVPGLAITLVILGFNLVGDGLRDYLDPTLREQVR